MTTAVYLLCFWCITINFFDPNFPNHKHRVLSSMFDVINMLNLDESIPHSFLCLFPPCISDKTSLSFAKNWKFRDRRGLKPLSGYAWLYLGESNICWWYLSEIIMLTLIHMELSLQTMWRYWQSDNPYVIDFTPVYQYQWVK